MKTWAIFLMFQLTLGEFSFAATKTIPQVGEHYPVFIFEKNENPQNVMVAYVKLSDDCQFQQDPKVSSRPLFDYYWLMDRKRFKPVHPLIKDGVRKRIEFASQTPDRRKFTVRLNDLSELNTNLEAKEIVITARKEGADCGVDGVMGIDISGKQELIRLEKIYSESKKTLRPPFRKVKAITLTGVDVDSDQKFERTFTASR